MAQPCWSWWLCCHDIYDMQKDHDRLRLLMNIILLLILIIILIIIILIIIIIIIIIIVIIVIIITTSSSQHQHHQRRPPPPPPHHHHHHHHISIMIRIMISLTSSQHMTIRGRQFSSSLPPTIYLGPVNSPTLSALENLLSLQRFPYARA